MELYEIKNFGKGYVDSINEEMADASSTQNCLNVTYNEEYGAVSKDVGVRELGKGSATYPIAAPVQRVYEGLVDVSGTSGEFEERKLIIAGGIPYSYCAGDLLIPLAGQVFSSISTTIPDITHAKNRFFIAAGHDYDIREWNGLNPSVSTNAAFSFSTSTSILCGTSTTTTTSVGWMYRAKTVEFFAKSTQRMFLGNIAESTDGGATWTTYENRIMYCQQNNIDVWSTLDPLYDSTQNSPGSLTVDDKSGDEIVRLFAHNDVLLIMKKNSMHNFIYTGSSDAEYERNCIDRRTIGNAPWTIADTPQGAVWLNEEGLQVTDGYKVSQLEASQSVVVLLRRMNISAMKYACATSNESRHEYSLAVPIDGSAYNNYLITWNWQYNTWKINDISATAIGMWTDSTGGTWEDIEDYRGHEISGIKWNSYLLYPAAHYIVFGDSSGYVKRKSICYNAGVSDVAYYGSAVYGTDVYGGTTPYTDYDAYHETPYLDFELPGVQKELLRIKPLWKGTYGASVTVSYKSDLDSSWTSTTIDTFDEDGMAEQDFLFTRKTGKRFKFRIENNNANEAFTLYKLMVFFNKRDWR